MGNMGKEHPVLSDEDVQRRLSAELPRWSLAGGCLERVYRTSGWRASLMVANTIGHLAEAAWHHPDVEVTWGKVWVKLRTHNAGGITEKDFALAKQIEQVTLWRPGEDSLLDGTPNKWVRGGSKE